MRAGELNKRVTLQIKTVTRTSSGAENPVWQSVATVWARFMDNVTGGEFFDAEKVNSEITQKIKIRYRSNVKPSMRAKYGNRYFDILLVENVREENKELILKCKEVI